ncbi:uncharacterized protein EAE98_000127 [Botrytis deweyae]|uniref:BTB domain-containing protein n=1 Tax=Botrytis deweyae TaxID=2478750 RepID=A0ABQ7J1T3_9HELO|nr:uncharacterized protein EAE98_000127 [Botrytis deweyae]KAF7940000.1 hypothetical protein EAE98_000127 [Botrytis deweyae]
MELNQPLGRRIQINVGNSEYHVHEELLRKNTKFFDIYERRRIMHIDISSEMFDSFIQWLYIRNLFKHPTGGVRVILELWFFAAKISCPELQNYAMDWIQDYHQDDWMQESNLIYVFETAKDDGGHNALEDFCVATLRQKNAGCFETVRDFIQAVPVALGPYLHYENSTFTTTMTRSANLNQMLSRIWAYISLVDIFESLDRLEKPSKVLGFATSSMTDSKQLVPSIHTARERRSFIW